MLDEVLDELEALRAEPQFPIAFNAAFWKYWPFLLAKLRAAVEIGEALNTHRDEDEDPELLHALAAWRAAGETSE